MQPSVCNFTKINTPSWVFLKFFILYEWYQIAQRTTYVYRIMWVQGNILSFKLMFDYHRIYSKNLMSGFSNFLRQEWIWLFKIPLNKVESCVRVEFSEFSFMAEFSKQETSVGQYYVWRVTALRKFRCYSRCPINAFYHVLVHPCFSGRWVILPHPPQTQF